MNKIHYAWVIVGVTFLVLLVGAGVRATPGILIVPLEKEFGWSNATISAAIAVNIFLYGTHMIPLCVDHGIAEVAAAGMLAMMGIFNIIGTTASGWLTDRIDSRVLLAWFYGLRGLSLMFVPYAFDYDFLGLALFGVFYGLDWIATVPPTVRLAGETFGEENAPVMFGWISASHQIGTETGNYPRPSFRQVSYALQPFSLPS